MVKLDFFQKNKANGSDTIMFLSLIAAVTFQADNLTTFALSDGITTVDLYCGDDLNSLDPKEKRKDMISALSIGEVYVFRNLRYVLRNGKLEVNNNNNCCC